MSDWSEIGFVGYFLFVAAMFWMVWLGFLMGKAKRENPQATEKDRRFGFLLYCIALMGLFMPVLFLAVGLFCLVLNWFSSQ